MICSLCWIWDLIDSNPSVTASQKLKFHLKTHGMYDTVVSNHVKLISLIASNSKCSVIQYCNVNSFPVSRSNYYGPCKLLTDSVNWPVRHRKLHLSSWLESEIDTWNDARQALLVAIHTQAKYIYIIYLTIPWQWQFRNLLWLRMRALATMFCLTQLSVKLRCITDCWVAQHISFDRCMVYRSRQREISTHIN